MINTKYQKRSVTEKEVIDHIVVDPKTSPKVILSVSPVRSGSTALMRVFAAAGIESYFQEMKNVLRWRMLGRPLEWQMPAAPNVPILLKETLGPYTMTECKFNPVNIIMGAGLPLHKLHVVILIRDPMATWASWRNLWGEATNVNLFAMAYQTMERIRLDTISKGMACTCAYYEMFSNHREEIGFKRLFHRLGLNFNREAIYGWHKLTPFGSPGSNIIFPREPSEFDMPAGLTGTILSNAFTYYPSKTDTDFIRKSEKDFIHAQGLLDIYDNWINICQKQLLG